MFIAKENTLTEKEEEVIKREITTMLFNFLFQPNYEASNNLSGADDYRELDGDVYIHTSSSICTNVETVMDVSQL